jgi:TonB-linked SusC/RagA family outer membrane protein
MKKLLLLFVLFVFVGGSALLAQTKVITGTVTSATEGEGAIPGVTVQVKGTTIGTNTDAKGKYTISVPQNATTIIFSYIGMKMQEIAIEGRSVVDVVMEPDLLGLNEVVVTAMGISREKKSLGYAVQEVSSDQIARAGNTNLSTNLAGKLAGVEVRQSSGMPGAPTTIFIRGARSFDGNNEPLYVVDGMPIASGTDYSSNVTGAYYSSRALDLDPNNIESIDVLKGQAAAALYGLRASNGVIVITTKSGKLTSKGIPTVNLTSSFTSDKAAVLPDVQQTYAQGYYEGSVNNASDLHFYPAFSYSWGPKITDLPNIPTYGGNSQGHNGQWFDPYKGQWVDPVAYNNAKNFFKTGSTFYNGINISNSTAFGNYLVGVSSTNQDAIVKSSGMERYTANASASVNLGEKWKAGFSGNYSDVKLQKLPSGNDSWLFTVLGAPASYDLMGTPYHEEGALGKYRQISYRRGAVGENPLWAVENNKFLEQTRRFFGNTYLEYNPLSWMNIRYQVGIDTYDTGNEDVYEAGSARNGQALPTAADYPTPSKPVYGYRAPTGGLINNYGLMNSVINSLLNITFKKDITQDLNMLLIVGNEFNDSKSRSWGMTGSGFVLPGWQNMANTTTQTASESKSTHRTVGAFANLAFSYRSMLFLNTTGRFDRVSSMPHGARSFFYPSVSLGFIFTELPGLKGNKILPYGKIRGSYAQVGQAGSYGSRVYQLGGAGSGFLNDGIVYPLGGISGFHPDRTLYDSKLKPQNTANWEVGLEMKFLDNRIGFDYTYSDQTATGQIFSVPMAGSTGYSSFVTNAGEMTSKAHELVFYVSPVRTNNFNWTINVNFTKIKNEVVKLAEGIESVSLAGYETPNVRAYAGNTYPTIYGVMMQRDAKGNILIDDDPNSYTYGMPISGGSGKIGDVSPDFIMGLTNTLSYKWISLSALFDWKQGGDIYSGTNRLIGLYGAAAFTEDRTTKFQYKDTHNAKGVGVLASTGAVNNITRGGPDDVWAYTDFYADVVSGIDEMNVYETSYIKLREVSLNFALPKSFVAPLKMKGASISLIGRNFLLWSTLPNVDPETSQGMGNGVMGFEYMSLPQTKSYGVTLNLTF